MKTYNLKVEEGGARLDSFLAYSLPEYSRSRLGALIAEGFVEVGGKKAKPSHRVKTGEEVTVSVPEPRPDAAEPQDLPLTVIYEDDWLVCVDKPAGLVVHPAPGHPDNTLVNALLHHVGGLSGVGGLIRPGIVHRLDKDTSGIMMAAKDDATHRALQDLFKARMVEKTYLALALGKLEGEGRIDSPIGRHPVDRKRMAAGVGRGRNAVTLWKALAAMKGATLLEIAIETGRTHQIRVHLASIGHPVAGDPVYGGDRINPAMDPALKKLIGNLGRQALHSWKLKFRHPSTGEELSLAAPIPEFLLALAPLFDRKDPWGLCGPERR